MFQTGHVSYPNFISASSSGLVNAVYFGIRKVTSYVHNWEKTAVSGTSLAVVQDSCSSMEGGLSLIPDQVS